MRMALKKEKIEKIVNVRQAQKIVGFPQVDLSDPKWR
jgi:hypothetical protein